jgi:hypothetical protein
MADMLTERKNMIIELLSWGQAKVLEEINAVQLEIDQLNAVPLFPGLRRFNEHDWMGLSGCSRFKDGTAPIISTVPLWVEFDSLDHVMKERRGLFQQGAVEEAQLVFDSEGISLIIGEESNDFHKQIHHSAQPYGMDVAIKIMQMGQDKGFPLRISFLVSVLGFKQLS